MKIKSIILASLVCAALANSSTIHANMVTDWNATAESVIAASIGSPARQSRALAIVNAAIFDAVNGITRKYEPYFVADAAPPGARAEAAVAQAAFTSLLGQFPEQSSLLEEKLAESLMSIPVHQGKSHSISRGRAWGQHVAEAILAWRENDGISAAVPPYLGGFDPGQWRAIPDGGVPGVLPQFATLLPFTMSSSSAFRPGPPPALDTAEYAADVNNVKAIGRVDSAVRNARQTQLALLWDFINVVDENAIARAVVPPKMDLVDTARLFALMNMATCDAFIAVWDAKYHYGLWRPFHAIRLADTDGNSATEPDIEWTSLLEAPNHPEYISGHATITSATLRVLALLLGDETPFTLSSPGLPGITADYHRLSDAAVEVGLSRFWGGIHFETACRVGGQVGAVIAEHAVTTHLLPR